MPGVIQLAEEHKVYIGGDDFKSGQTKMKSVMVDFLVRNKDDKKHLRTPLKGSIVSYPIVCVAYAAMADKSTYHTHYEGTDVSYGIVSHARECVAVIAVPQDLFSVFLFLLLVLENVSPPVKSVP